MGFAIGTGILVTLTVELILVPALIAWDNKGHSVIGNFLQKVKLGFLVNFFNLVGKGIRAFFSLGIFRWISGLMQFKFLEGSGRFINKIPVAWTWLVISAVLVVLSVLSFKKIQFEYDMLALEAEGIPSVITQEKILDRFEISPDYALLKSKNLEDDRKKIKQLKKIGNRTGLIGGVDGISEFVPKMKDQEKNRPVIAAFGKKVGKMPATVPVTEKDREVLAQELERLHMNFVEIGELSISGSGEDNKIIRKCDQIVGKKDEESKLLALAKRIRGMEGGEKVLTGFQEVLGPVLKERLLKMTSTDPITMEGLPENIRNRYVNPYNSDLLITVFPNSNIWEETILRRFQEKTSKVSERITGTPAIMLVFIDMMKEKGRIAVVAAAIAILLILLLDFQSIAYTLLAAIPLAAGAIWMAGMMALFGIKFNIVNFMVLPLILGIGIDDGVHILHRYRIEGRLSIPLVVRYTGRAILLTSLTTMIAFGSMGLASMKGTASMGQVLFLGVGACFISSAYTLTALITIIEKIIPLKTDKNGVKPEKEESNA
jgi:predicted RND superfamily exporter protein